MGIGDVIMECLLGSATKVSFNNVLLATDLAPSSDMAFSYARAFARDGSHVYTIHVNGANDYQLLCPEAFATTFNRPDESFESGSAALGQLIQGLPREVPVHGRRVWEVIADVASRNEIDLLIVGSHGRTGVQKLVLGSIAEEVLRDIPCPVLTVGPNAKAPNGGLQINSVLLATDCSPESLAPSYAAFLCETFGAELTVLAVGQEASVSPFALRQKIKQQLASTTPELTVLDPKPVFLFETGDPADKILQVAEAQGADLIVLGAHYPTDTRTAAHFPWPVAARVISRAQSPVLTARDAKITVADERWHFSDLLAGSGR